MSIKYTEQEIVDMINEVVGNDGIEKFYNAEFVNYSGTTKKTENVEPEKYTELVSRKLIELGYVEKLKEIKAIERTYSYDMERAKGREDTGTNREEENIAIEMHNPGVTYNLGEILSYQVPIAGTKDDSVGAIDLLAYDKDSNELRILELKRPDSDETMLRCVLEAYTYSKLIQEKKLKDDFSKKGVKSDATVIAAPLVGKNSKIALDFENEESTYLRKLMKELGVTKVFYYDYHEKKYFVETKEL